MQPARLAGVGEDERLRLAEHHVDGNAHGLDDRFDDAEVRGQTAAVEIANELNASGAPLLRFPGVLDRFRDDFEQHAPPVYVTRGPLRSPGERHAERALTTG